MIGVLMSGKIDCLISLYQIPERIPDFRPYIKSTFLAFFSTFQLFRHIGKCHFMTKNKELLCSSFFCSLKISFQPFYRRRTVKSCRVGIDHRKMTLSQVK